MYIVTRKIKNGMDTIGYEIEGSNPSIQYIDKNSLLELAKNGLVHNVKAIKFKANEYDLRGCNGTRLTELDTIDLDIQNVSIIGTNRLDFLIYLYESKRIGNNLGISFECLNEFRNNNLKDSGISFKVERLMDYKDMSVNMSLTWNNTSKQDYNIIVINIDKSYINLGAKLNLKNGEYIEIKKILKPYNLRKELRGILLDISNKVYFKECRDTRDFNKEHKEILTEYQRFKCIAIYDDFNNKILSFRNNKKLIEFVINKHAEVSTDIIDIDYNRKRKYIYRIKWSVQGHKIPYKIEFIKTNILKHDYIEGVEIEIKFRNNWKYKHRVNGKETDKIMLYNIDKSDIDLIYKDIEDEILKVISEADDIKPIRKVRWFNGLNRLIRS